MPARSRGGPPELIRSNRRHIHMRVSIRLMGALMIVAACGGADVGVEDPGPSDSPQGSWLLVEGVDVVDGFPVTLTIEGETAGGRAACNAFSANIRVEGSNISFGEIAQTEMACGMDVMDVESNFLGSLAVIDSFERQSDRLTLTGPDVALTFEPAEAPPTAEMVDTTWLLDSVVKGDMVSSPIGEPATLTLASDGTLSATTGCRTLTGRWQENGGVVIVPALSAEGECPGDVALQDTQVVAVIGDEFQASIEGDRLTLSSMGGDGLIYRPE